MKNFRNQINCVCNENFASVIICINWKLIVEVDFGAYHFCGTTVAKSRCAENGQNMVLPNWHQ